MAIGPLLHRRLCFIRPPVGNRRDLLALFASRAAPLLPSTTPEHLLDLLEARETQQSTVLMDGIAFPHAIGDAIHSTLVGVARLDPPLPYDVLHPPIQLCFALFGDAATPAVHVRTLARLARLVTTPEARAGLESATSPRELMEVVRRHDAGQSAPASSQPDHSARADSRRS